MRTLHRCNRSTFVISLISIYLKRIYPRKLQIYLTRTFYIQIAGFIFFNFCNYLSIIKEVAFQVFTSLDSANQKIMTTRWKRNGYGWERRTANLYSESASARIEIYFFLLQLKRILRKSILIMKVSYLKFNLSF